MSVLAEILRRTIREQGLLHAGDRLLIAVSGGPDSLAMLHALQAQAEEWGLAFLAAAHLDHGLRGAESRDEADFVEGWCAENGISCFRDLADVAILSAQGQGSIQEAARAARYAFLEEAAHGCGANKVATAHTQDDQAETVLLNILRGTGIDGLHGIPSQRGPYIRPLLAVPRAEVLAYCEEHNLNPRFDPSNIDTSHYTRNKIRQELLPLLEREYHFGARAALLRLSETAAQDADYLRQEAEKALLACVMHRESDCLTLDAQGLRALHPALLLRVLRAALSQMRRTGQGMTHKHVKMIGEAVRGDRRLPFGLTTPPPSCTVRVTQRRVVLRCLPEPGERQV